ncbi:hypothetical protein XENOCAPTIV_010377 [Xenoophorus captivus]|uniref:Protein kinase SIK1/2/3 UBA domain-containing protein n=1 Tax=Xenoophorus captivus TaxID=1517983 RepID=A0ABV0Q4S9_9TELE
MQTPALILSVILQSLQNKSYNHFAAIYYLLVERLKAHRCSFPVEQRLDARQRRPSTIAEQTVIKVNGCLLDPLPPTTVLRKSSTSSPSNMMETSIDEGIETEEPDAEDDPAHLLSAYQTARFGQRRHTLSEVTNQPGPSNPGKLFTMGHNPSMGSVDSDIGYDMGSAHSDLGLLEDSPSLSEVIPASSSTPGCSPAPFMMARPPNPAMVALTSQHRETLNRSPISFREGRRLVAFRQHLQNLARTKGILELNKVQMLVERMGSGDGAVAGLLGPQHHLHNLLEGPSMPAGGQPQPLQQGSPQASSPYGHTLNLSPLMQPGEGVVYDPYMSHHHYTQHLPHGVHLHHQLHHQQSHDASSSGMGFGFPVGCEQQALGPSPEVLPPDQYEFSINPSLLPPPAPGEVEARALPGVLGGAAQSDNLGMNELPSSLLDSEMMETMDSQQGFVLVN